MTTRSAESRRTLAALVADCEVNRREAISEWLLGMIPREDQPEVARLAAEIASAGQAPSAPAMPETAREPAPDRPDRLRGVWNATLGYVMERGHAEDMARRLGRGGDAGEAAALRREMDGAQERAVGMMGEIRARVKGAAALSSEGAAEAARDYLLGKAMDVQDAVRMVLRMAQEESPEQKRSPASPPPMAATEKPAAGQAPAAMAVAPAPVAPTTGFPFNRPAAPRRAGLPFAPAGPLSGTFAPGVFRRAPGAQS